MKIRLVNASPPSGPPSPLNITINYRKKIDTKGTGEASERRMCGEGRGGRKAGVGGGEREQWSATIDDVLSHQLRRPIPHPPKK